VGILYGGNSFYPFCPWKTASLITPCRTNFGIDSPAPSSNKCRPGSYSGMGRDGCSGIRCCLCGGSCLVGCKFILTWLRKVDAVIEVYCSVIFVSRHPVRLPAVSPALDNRLYGARRFHLSKTGKSSQRQTVTNLVPVSTLGTANP
jgi:hypothetical protein